MEQRNQRAILLDALGAGQRLTRRQVQQLIELASDEYEANKLARKSALRRLASGEERDNDLLLEVCRSGEQGVQRLAFDLLPRLLEVPPSEDTLGELARIASATDDVGLARRLVVAVGKIEPKIVDVVLDALASGDAGVRRCAFEAVEESWDSVLSDWGGERMNRFLDTCEAQEPNRLRWTDRLRKRRDELV